MGVKTIVWRLILLSVLLISSASVHSSSGWPDWDAFVERFVQADGRVIDVTFERKSTSEGQSYGLFFALVANQQEQFDTLLKWTSDNLAEGQLGHKLPAWLWGLRDDGSWGVKDRNSASDADLWIAYTLLEAARLWDTPHYADTAHKLLAQISRHEITKAGRIGPVLLPGAYGFKLNKDRFRINPSYLPEFMFHYLAKVDPKGPWQSVWDSYIMMAPAVFNTGVAPDLFVVDSNGKVMPDTEREPAGSYDAIRVYLWAGMSKQSDQTMLRLLPGYAKLIQKYGIPPERVDPRTGTATKYDYSPLGFSGAVLPYLSARGDKAMLEKQRQRLLRAKYSSDPTHYYDQVLILFGKGWLENRYRFDDHGQLQPSWRR